ncbi:hypothetical protein MMC30_006331 [Trapelia coarctata]|nr:hypothetical protein [Trapelia coarctata]
MKSENREEDDEGVRTTNKKAQKLDFSEDDEEAIWFTGFCVSNQLYWAKQVYEKSQQQTRLVSERNRAGDTVLSMTAMDGHEEVIKFLLDKGAKVDTVNAARRTPLMEAALWGRCAAVTRLLRAGASVSIKDRRGHTALDLAQDSHRNEKERASRSRVYSDDTDKRLQRRTIAALLGGSTSQSSKLSRPAIDNVAYVRIWKSGVDQISTFRVLTPTVEIPVENLTKTVAFLNRGSSFPIVRAKSGCGTRTSDPDYLDNCYWTDEVMRICKTIGYKLPPDDYDCGVPGRYKACHAEKQFMAFIAHKHRFTTEELDEDKDLTQLALFHRGTGAVAEGDNSGQYAYMRRLRDFSGGV